MISLIQSVTVVVNDQDGAVDFNADQLGWEKQFDEDVASGMRFITVGPVEIRG